MLPVVCLRPVKEIRFIRFIRVLIIREIRVIRGQFNSRFVVHFHIT